MAVYLLPHPRHHHTAVQRAGVIAGTIGWILLALAAGGLVMLGLAVAASTRELSEIRTGSNAQGAVVEAGPTRAFREYGFVRVVGTARNLGKRPLGDTEAVVELLDRAGRLLNVESALLEMPSIIPGDESPFSVHLRDASGAASYRVRFRTLLGPSLSTRYARP